MIGEKIKFIRTENGITGKELAEKAEVTPGYISQIERNPLFRPDKFNFFTNHVPVPFLSFHYTTNADKISTKTFCPIKYSDLVFFPFSL